MSPRVVDTHRRCKVVLTLANLLDLEESLAGAMEGKTKERVPVV